MRRSIGTLLRRGSAPGLRGRAGLLILLAVLLGGCVTLKDPEASQDYSSDSIARAGPGRPVGQSFVSRRAGLNGIQLWLRSAPAKGDTTAKRLTVELYHAPDEVSPLATVTLSFDRLTSFPVTIDLPAQRAPPYQVYYLQISSEDGEVEVFGRGEDAYPDGALFVDGQARELDAAFRASYDYGLPAALEDSRRVLENAWLLIPLALIAWVPGRLILWPVLRNGGWDWGSRAALSVGMSLAIAPLALLWTTSLGLRWSQAGVWSVYLLAAAALAVLFARERRQARFDPVLPRLDALDWALAAVVIFALALRLVMIRDLAGPPWVDPVHHSVITRQIIEQGALPTATSGTGTAVSAAEGASYHPGFHTTVAALHWLSGLEIPDAMLLFGQIENALAALAVYLMAVTLTHDRRSGVLAALIAGAFYPMPAYYLSWGRYTQLAGLVILPAAVALLQAARQRSRSQQAAIFCAAVIACAGVFLTHYRVAAFLALWLAAYVLAETLRSLDKSAVWSSLSVLIGPFLAVGLASILVTLPWWPELWGAMIAPRLGANPPAPIPLKIEWGYLTPVFGRQVIWLALLGLLAAIVRLDWFGPTLALWVGLMFMSANQGSIRLPLAGSVNKNSVEISLYIPFAILAGYFISTLLGWVRRNAPGWLWQATAAAAAAAAAILALMAAPKMLNLLNPGTLLLREPDRPALAWMDANLPKSAVVMTNPFLWGYGAYAGADGGYWISAVTGQRSMPPTVLYNLGDRGEIERINRICKTAVEIGKDAHKLHELLQAEGIGYVYLGRRGGVISAQALRDSGLFRLLYERNGVRIFKVE